MTCRALLVDRDGVINVDHGYVCAKEDFEFIDGIFDLCRYAAQLGFLNIVVTNQAGIGRGYYSEHDFLALTDWMCDAFRERGAPIARVYHCPFHPEHGVGAYKRDSVDRKPAPGMILRAKAEFNLDLGQSTLVGDKDTDVQAGIVAGVGCNLLYRPRTAACDAGSLVPAASVVRKLTDVMPFLRARSSQPILGDT